MVIRLHYPTKLIEISFKAGELYTPSNDLSEAGANHNPLRLNWWRVGPDETVVTSPTAKQSRPSPSPLPQLLYGIFCILGTDAPWPDLPECYAPGQTVANRFVAGKRQACDKSRWRFCQPKAAIWIRSIYFRCSRQSPSSSTQSCRGQKTGLAFGWVVKKAFKDQDWRDGRWSTSSRGELDCFYIDIREITVG